jgi:TRAP-type C4-dicarboxylate transport system substrate-binding protein
MAEAIVGPSIIFSRTPLKTFADLRKARLWVWDLDRLMSAFLPDMGIPAMPLPVQHASRAYEESRIDGFVSPAVVALAFQWSTETRYYTDLRLGFLVGCLLLSSRAFDSLPLATQNALRVASAKGKARFEEVGRAQEEQLMHGLFERQGLVPVHVDEATRNSFFEAAQAARERSASRIVAPSLITRVLGMLADLRSAHR